MNSRTIIVLSLLLLLPAKGTGQDVYGGQRRAIDLGAYKGFILEPPKPGPEGTRPWVWYAPVLGNNPGKQTAWMLRQLFEAGFFVAGVNVGESITGPPRTPTR